MGKTDTTATPTNPLAIPLPDNLKDPLLRDAIVVHNAMYGHNLIALYPEDLTPEIVHADLLKHLNQLTTLGTARSDVTDAVQVRGDALTRGAYVYGRVGGLIDKSYPPGAPGRVIYHPTDTTDPTLGDLLIAAGKGILKKGRPPLPDGWTPQSLIALGEEVNKALLVRDATGKVRKGQSKATAALIKRTREIRRRLRGLVIDWFGATNPALVAFGITPRGPKTGGRRKKAASAPAVQPTTNVQDATPEA